MNKAADFLELWSRACEGTIFEEERTIDLLRSIAVQTLVKNWPDTTADEMAPRLRLFIPFCEGYSIMKVKVIARFLRSLPPETPIKTIVEGLWV